MLSLNGQTLAYIGDAVYELMIREYHIDQGLTQVNNLHEATVKYTNAQAQFQALKRIDPYLTESEKDIVKRGRNASSSRKPGQSSLSTYRLSTGFEALIGYLHLTKNTKRLETLLGHIVDSG